MNKVMKYFVEDNHFGLKITKSRERFFAAIKKTYLSSPNLNDSELFMNTISNLEDIDFKKKILFLETCRQDRLFHDITTKLFTTHSRLIHYISMAYRNMEI